jgi:hypothetical protein
LVAQAASDWRANQKIMWDNGSNHRATGVGGASPLHIPVFSDRISKGRKAAPGESSGIVSHDCPEIPRSEKGWRLTDPEVPKPDHSKVGRRSAPRLRLSLPGQLVAVERVHRCILLNLSRSGAQVAILDALREGEGAILRCGVIDQFAVGDTQRVRGSTRSNSMNRSAMRKSLKSVTTTRISRSASGAT